MVILIGALLIWIGTKCFKEGLAWLFAGFLGHGIGRIWKDD